ncbi:MAG: alpha-galactosidase [Paraprevotella sp.]|nr:alpha-galactosidase [Paraprevotella sp.]
MRRNYKILVLFVLQTLLLSHVVCAYERPTMGWSSWNAYGFKINENIIKSQADAIVSTGLMDAGYIYLNIDDGFFGGRDSEGHLLIHPTRFPNGMRPIVDYIHAKGLKAGIYSDAGKNTCASYWGGDEIGVGVGLYGHDQEDIDLYFKELNFDFIKVDFCGGDPGHNVDKLDLSEQERYTAIHQAIVNTGRTDVRLNVCRWAFPGTWVHDVATSWRISEDIYLGWNSIKSIVGQNLYLSAYATEGKYNDMDMLEVGRGLSAEEDKTHFGMWCIMSSPLLIGCDMTTISKEALDLMTNKELIALNQDTLGLQAYVVKKEAGAYLLVKDVEKLYGKNRAIAIYNPTDAEVEFEVDFLTLDLGGRVLARDLFEKKDEGTFVGSMSVKVPAHGTRIYKLTAEQRYERTKYEGETAWLSAYQELFNNQSAETGIYEELAVCSGGAKAGWLGKSEANDLQWRNVYSENGGEYTMTLAFITGESRNVKIQVNDEEVQTLSLNSGGWSTLATIEVDVTLKKGNNIIRLSNASAWMPDIDCMDIVPKGSLDLYKHQLEAAQGKLSMLLEKELPLAVKGALEEAISETQNIEPDKDAYVQATEQLQKLYDDAVATLPIYKKIQELAEVCEGNIIRSLPGTIVDDFANEVETYLGEVDEITVAKDFTTLYNKLKSAAVDFHTSEAANPKVGEQWDVTFLLANTTFDGDDSGWTSKPTIRANVAEFWNMNFTMYQTIRNIKNGEYTVKVQALYREGENDGGAAFKAGTENITAQLSAGVSVTKPIASLYSYLYDGDTSTFGSLDMKNGYVNSMAAAAKCFEKGEYWNSLDATVTNNRIRVGLLNSGTKNDSWCCFDNFCLYYRGGDPSSVTNVMNNTTEKVDVYTIDGVLCKLQVEPSKALDGLRKGVYIVGNKKIEVK